MSMEIVQYTTVSIITIKSRCHASKADWRPEPGSPKWKRDTATKARNGKKK